MSDKNANDNANSLENGNDSDAAQALHGEEDHTPQLLDDLLESRPKKNENESVDLDSYLPPYESPLRREENPFSFKKFLNQDSSSNVNKGARKKVYSTPPNISSADSSKTQNHRSDLNSRISASDMSSVLPDFVQDHLVIEQCYLSGDSSDIDLKNINLQNLPDLNLEHRNVHFMLRNDPNSSSLSDNQCENFSSNLPDFAIGATSKVLPDFALHTRTDSDSAESRARRNPHVNNGNNSSQFSRRRVQISSSPSVPLDLPSYENDEAESASANVPMPFDLTAPTEENNSSCRGRTNNETVSKSLPDFLSDGPIKKEFDENARGILQNGLPSDMSSSRAEERLQRQIDLLQRQLIERNRRIERLEREVEHLHSTDQRETASLEYALQEVEKNLQQTAKRALTAENQVVKLKQENKSLKSEISSLKSENLMLRVGNYDVPSTSTPEPNNGWLAKELRNAAGQAETSLKALLVGVDNLRVLADTIESVHKFEDASKDFPNEDSASGPAL